jgi:hypothetical protein
MGKILYAEAMEAWEVAAPRLEDLDSNQVPYAERAIDRMAMTNPTADEACVVAEAIRQAEANLATAKEAAERIAEMRDGPAYCYLAFYGLDDTANYMKVGMTRHPEQRLYHMATGNPLDCLWVFVSRLPVARAAFHVEKFLHRHLEAHRRRGEWFAVGNADWQAASALARQLYVVALEAEPEAREFTYLGYGDGH